jgi:ABC-type polysaccharide/polyol phosphate export permease
VAETEIRVRTNAPPRLRPFRDLRELWRSREILVNLARKELKVKYKSSALGVAWSMLNPVLYLVVFYLVFSLVLRSDLPDFQIYLVSGLLAWTLFSTGFQGATTSVTDNGPLVSKVAFPREVLPLASIGAQLVNFAFQLLVLVGALIVFGKPFLGESLILLPAALVVLLVFTTALGFATAAFNVKYRDTGHLVELAMLAWFWGTPIVYPVTLVTGNIGDTAAAVYLANPMANIVLAFQRALYGPTSAEALSRLPEPGIAWYAERLFWVGLASAVLLYVTWWVFHRMAGDFSEEL